MRRKTISTPSLLVEIFQKRIKSLRSGCKKISRKDPRNKKKAQKNVKSLVQKHNQWRREECLNLIASENVMSPLAEECYTSDLEGRYNEHEGQEYYYKGTKYSRKLEIYCNKLFAERFQTKKVDCRPISGSIANLCIYHALLQPGDIIVTPSTEAGGHISHHRGGVAGVKGLRNIDMYFDYEKMQVDVKKTVELINKVKPKFVMFGRSVFLFPEPLTQVKKRISSDIKIVYDSAHVLGLLYGHEFQHPFEEGADIITASTHKTFPGPQGGIIIADEELESEEWRRISNAVFPQVLSNHHIHKFPSLAITALEMNEFGEAYAKQTVKNAKALAEALYERNFDVLFPKKGFTATHQLVMKVDEFGAAKKVADKLEENNIIVNTSILPLPNSSEHQNKATGIRLGSQELTRWGMKEKDMNKVAEIFETALQQDKNVVEEVRKLRKKFSQVHYCFENERC